MSVSDSASIHQGNFEIMLNDQSSICSLTSNPTDSNIGPSRSSIPVVVVSSSAPLSAAILDWSLDAPSISSSGLTFSQRNHASPSSPSSYSYRSSARSPNHIQRFTSTNSYFAKAQSAALTSNGKDPESPTLLENTLKLTSLGVSSTRPEPNVAAKVTLSDRCQPDPKVVFDQERFRRRQNQRRSSTVSSISTGRESSIDPDRRGSIGGIIARSNGFVSSNNHTLTGTNSESASVSSPSSSTAALPAVVTPESSLIVDIDQLNINNASTSGSPSPLRRSAAAWQKPRSWADLASRLGPPVSLGDSTVFSETVNGEIESNASFEKSHQRSASSPMNLTRKNKNGGIIGKVSNSSISLIDLINEAETQFVAPLTYPRGMVNKGNMCFANAILQTLVYCAPFYNLFRLLGQNVPHDFHNSTPLMEAVIHFLSEFHIISKEVQKKILDSPGLATDSLRDIQAASEPFVPEPLYDAMKLNKRFDTMRRGHQEDAEEFLGFFLDTLHEELQNTIERAEARERKLQGKLGQEGPVAVEKEVEEEERVLNRPSSPTEGDGWLEVGQKGKTSFTRTTSTSHSPITRIFGGKLRSVLRTPGSKDSVTLEPYQPLQLDIQPSHVTTVEEALENLTRPETISGVLSSTKTLVDATKQVFIESLPPILILHLKRFYYDDIGGVQKSSKVLGYGSNLEIAESVISPARRGEAQRRYKLFGVVYHHGRFASGGHYTVDVLRQDRSEWLHIDDTTWSTASAPQSKAVYTTNGSGGINSSPMSASPRISHKSQAGLNSPDGGSAYLLFYVREDALPSTINGKELKMSALLKNGKPIVNANSFLQNDLLLQHIAKRKMADANPANASPIIPGASHPSQRKAGTAK